MGKNIIFCRPIRSSEYTKLSNEYTDKELDIIRKFINDWRGPYGDDMLEIFPKHKKINKFSVGDEVCQMFGCNAGIPCIVVKTYIPEGQNKQWIIVKPVDPNVKLKGHRASRYKVNEHCGSADTYKFVK